ncbi:MAG: DsbA family protein [Actinomycetes bacterium]
MAKKKSTATRRAEQTAAAERAAAIRKEQERKERRRRAFTVGGVVAAVLTLVLLAGYAVQSARDTTGEAGAVPSGVVDEYAVPYGQESAPVTVTIYEDFMCPFCGDFEQASEDMLEGYVDAGDVQVEYRALSFLDRASDGSDYSTRAMNALGVVLDTAGPDVAKRFHDLLFDDQPEEGTPGPTDDELIAYAVEAGASEDAVSRPIRDLEFEQWVLNATDAASQEDVSSTPTVMVDGEVVEFATIDELLANTDPAIQEGLGS